MSHPYRQDLLTRVEPTRVSWFGRWLCRHNWHRDRLHRIEPEDEPEYHVVGDGDISFAFYTVRGYARCTRCNREENRFFRCAKDGSNVSIEPDNHKRWEWWHD